jgi:protein SCO1/2
VTFVTVTTDPTNDTADVMRGYGPTHGLDSVNWLFLTKLQGQPEDATRSLAEAFGHGFDKTDEGLQIHGIVTHVIDADGRWRANFHGLKFQSVNLLTFVNALTNGSVPEHGHGSGSWWDTVVDLF